MTPFEKSLELMDKMSMINGHKNIFYKQCALIAVDEMLKAVNNPDETYLMKHYVNYWSEVKKEIEAL
jgi:hypothetical protein